MAPPKGMRRTVTMRRADILDSLTDITPEDIAAAQLFPKPVAYLAEHTGRSPRDVHSCLTDLLALGWIRLEHTARGMAYILTHRGWCRVRIEAYHRPRLFPTYVRRRHVRS